VATVERRVPICLQECTRGSARDWPPPMTIALPDTSASVTVARAASSTRPTVGATPHGGRCLLVTETLHVDEAHGFQLVDRQGHAVELAARDACGLEERDGR
jgi:hypothetical protein